MAESTAPSASAFGSAPRTARGGTLRSLGAVTLGVALGWLIVTYVATAALVDGSSMEPSLHDGDLVVLLRPGFARLVDRLFDAAAGGSRLPDRHAGYAPGDVVALALRGGTAAGSTGDRTGGTVLKRVVAVGPATVSITSGSVTVDGRPISHGSHPGYVGTDDLAPVSVAPGELFALGDNRRPLASRDSRHYGPVAGSAVRGRLLAAIPLGGLLAR